MIYHKKNSAISLSFGEGTWSIFKAMKKNPKYSILDAETLHANIGLKEFQNKAKTTIIYA